MKKIKKSLVMLMALVMVISLMPMTAMAGNIWDKEVDFNNLTEDELAMFHRYQAFEKVEEKLGEPNRSPRAAADNIAVYVYKDKDHYQVHELGQLAAGATALDALNLADSTVNYNDSQGGTWLYTINGKMAGFSAKDYKVQDGDFLAFYKVPDYTKDTLILPSYHTEWVDEHGILHASTTSCTLGGDYGMEMSLNYAHPTVKMEPVTSEYQRGSSTGYSGYLFIEPRDSSNSHNVLTTCYPVIDNKSMEWLSYMRNMLAKFYDKCDQISKTEIGNQKITLDKKVATARQMLGMQNAYLFGSAISVENYFAELNYLIDARLDHVEFTGDLAVTTPFYPYTTDYIVESTSVDPEAIPNTFVMKVKPKDPTASISVIESTGVEVTPQSNKQYLITLPWYTNENKKSTLTIKINKSGVIKDYTFTIANPKQVQTEASVYACLPAPGQFTNERVGEGGWGDPYMADGTLKMNTPTGVSLGFFGGYMVYDFGSSEVKNSPKNKYGADFIVYGNAFWGNSEPGCIQVAPDENKDGKPDQWYDIASSRYYREDTDRDASIRYLHPNQDEDMGENVTVGTLGEVTYYTPSTSNVEKKISTNSFHNHSWFPLRPNYFLGRFGNPALDKTNELDFVSRNLNGTATESLIFTGVKLGTISTNDTAGFGFGYCDAHPNKELGGSIPYNPYFTFANQQEYNTKAEGTSGGDPIDISWSVDQNGNPVDLSSIRFVRVYTGVAQMNGIFGEVSTEVCGISRVEKEGQDVGMTTAPVIKGQGSNLNHSAMGVNDVSTNGSGSYTFKISNTGENTTVNGSPMNDSGEYTVNVGNGETKYFQVITQTGEKEPYITLFKITK